MKRLEAATKQDRYLEIGIMVACRLRTQQEMEVRVYLRSFSMLLVFTFLLGCDSKPAASSIGPWVVRTFLFSSSASFIGISATERED